MKLNPYVIIIAWLLSVLLAAAIAWPSHVAIAVVGGLAIGFSAIWMFN